MTVTTSVAEPTTADTDETRRAISARMRRGFELHEARGHEIRKTSASTYLVPGSRPGGGYVVDYRAETCECRDFEYSALRVCKHLAAVGCLRAARRADVVGYLAALEDRAAHEDMDPDERGELLDRIRRGRRFLAPVGA